MIMNSAVCTQVLIWGGGGSNLKIELLLCLSFLSYIPLLLSLSVCVQHVFAERGYVHVDAIC